MFDSRIVPKRSGRDEAEKPFWISFADLMTALMILFLIVMGVALLAVTKTVTERDRKEEDHRGKIEQCLDGLEQAAKGHEGVIVDKFRHAIDYGQRAQFAFGDWRLNAQQEEVLRGFVPEILKEANEESCRSTLKRVLVEGYTDKTGSYLSNLNLSLERSQKVLCSMFATTGPSLLSEVQKEDVRRLFFVGGYSFNDAKETADESRRVEMRLEFLAIDEIRNEPSDVAGNFGECALR